MSKSNNDPLAEYNSAKDDLQGAIDKGQARRTIDMKKKAVSKAESALIKWIHKNPGRELDHEETPTYPRRV